MLQHFIKILLFSIFVSVIIVECELLIRKGWYRNFPKSPKFPLVDIKYIDNQIVNASDYLRLSGHISKIPHGGIRDLPKLTTIKISLCGIEDIMPGAFQNLPNLATMALTDNGISHIKQGVFNKLNITVLYLQRNDIETVDSGAFDDMPNLYRIKLNSNKITVWESDWFKNTPRITELSFRRNSISEIPPKAFKNIQGSHAFNSELIVDTKIFLSKNNIVTIDPNAFENFTEFSQLWLDRNEIEDIDEGVFASVIQIGGVFLGKNRIRKLPRDLFPSLKSEMQTLDLSRNHNLTCISYEVVSKVKVTNMQSIRRLNCECVRGLTKQFVNESKENSIKSNCPIGTIS